MAQFRPPPLGNFPQRLQLTFLPGQLSPDDLQLMLCGQNVGRDCLQDIRKDRLQFFAVFVCVGLKEQHVRIRDDVLWLKRKCHEITKTRAILKTTSQSFRIEVKPAQTGKFVEAGLD